MSQFFEMAGQLCPRSAARDRRKRLANPHHEIQRGNLRLTLTKHLPHQPLHIIPCGGPTGHLSADHDAKPGMT